MDSADDEVWQSIGDTLTGKVDVAMTVDDKIKSPTGILIEKWRPWIGMHKQVHFLVDTSLSGDNRIARRVPDDLGPLTWPRDHELLLVEFSSKLCTSE